MNTKQLHDVLVSFQVSSCQAQVRPPGRNSKVMKVVASQPVVDHVAQHDAVLRHGEEGVDEGLAVLVVAPVEVEGQTGTDQGDLGQDPLVLDGEPLVVTV